MITKTDMAETSELIIISEEIDSLKDKKTLSAHDVNRMMLIAGRLTGILRVCSNDNNIQEFITRVDSILLSPNDNVKNLFYLIPVAIELLDKQYSGNVKLRKRYRNHKKKYVHRSSVESKSNDDVEEVECEGGVCKRRTPLTTSSTPEDVVVDMDKIEENKTVDNTPTENVESVV
tara:strand:- start:94 stop:618 length:525 start_codon:yes stop_codon:yes gene_type:complete